MEDILIVGAGGFGREVWNYLQHAAAQSPGQWQVRGFLDDTPNALDGLDFPQGIVGTIRDYAPAPNERLVCALGTPQTKQNVCTMLKARGARFMSLIHPTAIVCRGAKLGEGVVLAPGVLVSDAVTLGDFVMLNCHTTCGHDVSIGDFSTLSSHCDLTGGVQLGQRVFAGSRASVIPDRRIGNDVSIGAGSVVVTHLESGKRVFGVPAKNLM